MDGDDPLHIVVVDGVTVTVGIGYTVTYWLFEVAGVHPVPVAYVAIA